MDTSTKELGPLVREYARLLSGRDAAEDGPEVEIICAIRHYVYRGHRIARNKP